ncbi:putative lipoprotein [Desulfonatronospira thiodismutans ASO3-1]|uniref:Lipoprotein n=1 Tax=Desulfonatronospira thiodismutans ASO3-1 TaxID=555779 RepID=D6SQN8_9BACT|nr:MULTISPECIES: hypothetical protein [Desulfonatronospira]EFI35064.1 putative lipoprotein [Desulfonatronospira thiodismutans ASO3-1]RQD78341.1 MAG: hypothetical protein D5S03_02695 [Desulfonatronospira sp. MSAO_Bac3]
MIQRCIILITGVIILALTACAPREPVHYPPEDAVVAVAGFSQPKHRWEMITNHITVDQKKIDKDVIEKLDSDLAALLRQSRQKIVYPEMVKQCKELVAADTRPESSAFHFWVQVGKCIPADYILVPFVFEWRERIGGPLGVQEPAAVVMELNLIDLQDLQLQRFFFDERQFALLEDLSSAGKFFRRGGKWISARQLANEGLEQGVRELGL